VSKNGLNALSTLQQKFFDESSSGIIVSAVHPGEVTTDMNKYHGTIMPDEGSETIVYLALKEESVGVPGGKFWYEKQVLDWADVHLDLAVFH
jgi:NAD(P)-dependent dehydrogenase (short-subunit alcohol dehydrogenase family)